VAKRTANGWLHSEFSLKVQEASVGHVILYLHAKGLGLHNFTQGCSVGV